MYEVGGWEAAHRGGAWRVRERREGEDEPSAARRRIGRDRGIRLPIEGEEEEGKSVPSRWKKPGVREIRRLDKERRERSSRGFPSFVRAYSFNFFLDLCSLAACFEDPDSLVDMDEDSRPQPARDAHPALLYHSHFVDLVETHSSVPFALAGIDRKSVV